MSSRNNGLIRVLLSCVTLMNSNGKFLTFEEFQNKFEIKANYLLYFQLIAAIPQDLKRKEFGSMVPDLLGATEYCQMEDRAIVLTKFRCKNYYSLFIEKLVSEPSAVKAWKKSFSEWLVRVSKFPMAALENKTIWLCFRLKFFTLAFKCSTFRSRWVWWRPRRNHGGIFFR